MHFRRISITLLVLIAHVHCATLRQYSRDWLIPLPDPQVGSKRITAKSVFIAPTFHKNVRCVEGFREDASGRCVKLVQVSQAAQLDFLLQRLNVMYGEEPVLSHSDKQPLQVAVGIPVEPTGGDATKPEKTGEMYSQAAPLQGELFLDKLKPTEIVKNSSTENSTKVHDDKLGSVVSESDKKPSDKDGVLPVKSGHSNITGTEEDSGVTLKPTPFVPSKEMFYVEEEPIVTLITVTSEDEENMVHPSPGGVVPLPVADGPSEESPNGLASTSDESVEEAASETDTSTVTRNETQTLLGDVSVHVIKKEVPNTEPSSSTEMSTTTEHGGGPVVNVDIVDSADEESTQDNLQGESTARPANEDEYEVIEPDESAEEEATNQIDTQSSAIDEKTTTSSGLDDQSEAGESNMMTSMVQETSSGSSSTKESITKTSSTQESSSSTSSMQESITSSSSTQESFTSTSSTQQSNSFMSSTVTDDGYDDLGEEDVTTNKTSNKEEDLGDGGESSEDANLGTTDNVYDYTDYEADLEADYKPVSQPTISGSVDSDTGDERDPTVLSGESVDGHLAGGEDKRTEINRGESGVVQVDDDESVDEGELVKFDDSDNENTTKTNVSEVLEGDKVVVPERNGTKFGEMMGVSQGSDNGTKRPVVPPLKGGLELADSLDASTFNSQSTVVDKGTIDILKTDSTSHNVDKRPDVLLGNVQSMALQTQQESFFNPTHPSVHVIYSQPITQVQINQNPERLSIVDANNKEHDTKPGDSFGTKSQPPQFQNSFNSNSNPAQYHNLNPVNQMPIGDTHPHPLQFHNLNPVNQMPLIEKPQEIPPKYGGYPYPPLPPQQTDHQLHNRPHQPPINRYHNTHNGYVRFPSERVQGEQYPHSHSYVPKHDPEVNTVRFPHDETRYNDKYSRWGGNNWRFDDSRGHRPDQRYWPNREQAEGTNRRNYWIDNWPNRRRSQSNRYH